MAITFSDNFLKRAEVNDGSQIAVVHLFYSSTEYLPLSTTAVEVDDGADNFQHIACVIDDGSYGTLWKIGTDNLVTITAPTITLMQYETPQGYSLINDLNTKGILGGQRIIVYLGYDGLGLSDYAVIFDGKIEEPKFDGGKITLECVTEETPKTIISGSKIDAKAGKFGDRDVDALSVIPNEAADGKLIPVVFGYHWNAPGIAYEIDDDENISIAFDDAYWGGSVRSTSTEAQTTMRLIYRHNLNRTSYRILLAQDGRLVPIFDRSSNTDLLNGYNVLYGSEATDLRDARLDIGSVLWFRYKISAPDDCWQILYDGDGSRQIFTDIPLRPRVAAGTSPTSNLDCEITYGNFNYFFDGDADNYMSLACDTDGTPYMQIDTYIRLWEQLAHDAKCIPRKGRLISLAADPTGAVDEFTFTTLFLGRFKLTAGDGTSRDVRMSVFSEPAYTSESRFHHPTDYNYYSQLIQQNADGTWHAYDPTTDKLSYWNGTGGGYVGNGGDPTAVESEGQLPFLGRTYFERYEGLRIRAGFSCNNSTEMTGTFYDIALHNMRPVPLPVDDYVSADYIGFTWNDCNPTLLSRPDGQDNNYTCVIPPQYIETIIRVKASDFASFNATEWGLAHENFELYFGTHRDESGFSITEETKLDDFLKDYLKYEPFSVFVDGSGVWRLKYQHKTLADIEAQETIYTVEYMDIDGRMEFGLTPKEWLCAEIKSCESDRIYLLDDYAEKHNWKLDSGDYDYSTWDANNTAANNKYFLERMELKYTSSCVADYVTYDGVRYGCLRTNSGQTPNAAGSTYWTLLSGENSTDWGGTPDAWSDSVVYRGSDAENRAIAEFYLNQYANRHRTVRFSTLKKTYLKHEVGDYIQFANVPDTLLGMTIKGFAGEEDEETVVVNGQNAYYVFIITGIRKSMNRVTIDCMQCHDLSAYRALEGGEATAFA